ncbi:MAG: hypothetical protein HWN51_07450 [Desulfobacterales bacterium]|nr:hypothetical protein [Desulfobacterales bacterium]
MIDLEYPDVTPATGGMIGHALRKRAHRCSKSLGFFYLMLRSGSQRSEKMIMLCRLVVNTVETYNKNMEKVEI